MTQPIRLTKALSAEYQQLFASCTVQSQHQTAVERLARQLTQQQPRYAAVEKLTHIPWPIIAVIHAMEASQRFDRHLHNGDPLHSRTVQAPAHRPLTKPPFTWEASAIDALTTAASPNGVTGAWPERCFSWKPITAGAIDVITHRYCHRIYGHFLGTTNAANTPPTASLIPT